MTDNEAPFARCNICGGLDFSLGPSQRLSITRRRPQCTGCRSLERHRVARRVFERLRPEFTDGKRMLQLSWDSGIERDWFAELTVASCSGENGLDLRRLDVPDGRYDWVYSSHVLNHVLEQGAALKEMLRVVGEAGVVLLSVGGTSFNYGTTPSPMANGADPQFRTYGSDFADELQQALPSAAVLELVAADPCTASIDALYLYSRSEQLLLRMARRAVPDNIHARVLRARLPGPARAGHPERAAAVTSVEPVAPCNVCGSTRFAPGPSNRLSFTDRLPRCTGCGTLERNRILRRAFDAVAAGVPRGERLLQLPAEPGLPAEAFAEVFNASKGSKDELNAQATGLPDARYDWLSAYHLLDDGPNDGATLNELLRVVGPNGVLALSLRGSASRYELPPGTVTDWQAAAASSEFVTDAQQQVPELGVLELVTSDPCTETVDAVYFCSKNAARLQRLARLGAPNVQSRLFPAPAPLESAPVTSGAEQGNGWNDLHSEISAWVASGRRARFWVRDDDATSYTPALASLLALCHEEAIPIALAVIPEQATDDLKEALAPRANVTVLQHGFDHKNRSSTREKSEFPAERPLSESLSALRAGWQLLSDRFGRQAMPVFVPPWGTCAQEVQSALPRVRFIGFSPSPIGPFQADVLCRRGSKTTKAGLSAVGTHLAVNRARVSDTSPLPISRNLAFLTHLVRSIRNDAQDPDEPIGIMTHAWGVDESVRDFLRELFRVTRAAGAQWASARDLF